MFAKRDAHSEPLFKLIEILNFQNLYIKSWKTSMRLTEW